MVRPLGGAAKGQRVVAPSADEFNLAIGNQFGPRQLAGIEKITGPDFGGVTFQTAGGAPLASSYGEFDEILPIFTQNNLLEQYDPTTGAEYNNYGTTADMADESAAPITVVPTSTTNPERPRTVAAGYDKSEQKITVVFRDGTYYNYYEVSPTEWQAFKARVSKGRYIYSYLDSKPRGPADIAGISATARKAFYRIARGAQQLHKGRPGKPPKPKKP
jgi:KTSC domain